MMTSLPPARRRRRFFRQRRRAGVVLELIVSLPVLLIAFLAILQFGLFFAGLQQLALASREGAQAAAQYAGLPTSNGPVPASIMQAVGRQLEGSGITTYGVLVEHNVDTPTPVSPILLASGSPTCMAPATPLPTSGQYVRVTVCVNLTDISPDLLGMFGFSMVGREAQQTSTFRYEM
jgi:Flp pilus assembly protein TadG